MATVTATSMFHDDWVTKIFLKVSPFREYLSTRHNGHHGHHLDGIGQAETVPSAIRQNGTGTVARNRPAREIRLRCSNSRPSECFCWSN